MPTKKYKTSDGKRVPGVTTIISTSLGWGKEGLLHWAWEKGQEGLDFREERDKAASAGSIAHAMAEADIKGQTFPNLDLNTEEEMDAYEKASLAFYAYLQWKEMTKLRLVHSEISFVSDVARYGGTLDAVAEFGTRLELIDFKTSNGTYADHIIQLAAYSNLWDVGRPFETEGVPTSRKPFDGIHLCRFSKSGDFHHSYYAANRMAQPWDAFLHLRALYDLQKQIKGML